MKKLTVAIPCKDRQTELCLLLQSLLDQTYQDFDILIIEDSQISPVTKSFIFQMSKNLLESSGHKVFVIEGQRKGPHYAGQMILENSKTELIFRVDDDIILRPDCLQELVKVFDDKDVVAAGPIYLHPGIPIQNQIVRYSSELDKTTELVVEPDMITADATLQCNIIQDYPTDCILETQHLHSGFMYRRQKVIDIGGYCLEYSKVGHREETDLSYRLYQNGGKLRIVQDAICFHFHPPYGGIRCTSSCPNEKELWKNDDQIFIRRFLSNISIVMYAENIDNLKDTIESVISNTNFSCNLLVTNYKIDSKSMSAFRDEIVRKYPRINFTFMIEKNLSKSKILNKIIRLIPEDDYICFMNCDIIGKAIDKNWTTKMIQDFNKELDTILVSYVYKMPEFDSSLATDGLLFTKKKFMDKIGKFDTVLRGNCRSEIIEWSYRAKSQGYKIQHVDETLFKTRMNILNYITQFPEEYHKAIELIKDKYDINLQNVTKTRKKLNLGCGDHHIEGFENIDIDPDCNPDTVYDIRKLDIQNNSVSIILIQNVLEHFEIIDIRILLKKFYDWLEKNGLLIIEVPDIGKIMNDISKGITSFEDMKYEILGDVNSKYQKHRYQFCKQELTELLKEVGFDTINDLSDTRSRYTLRLECKKN